jgi:hypothetical protein
VTAWRNPDGRRALTVLGVTVGLAVISNITATIFWHLTGGVGLLDLDGGANLLQPAAAHPLPAAGTPTRVRAILAAYTPQARLIHAVLLCTLDLAFPLLIGLTGWTTIAWASRTWTGHWRTGVRLSGAALALTYSCVDWAENVTELLLLAGRRGELVRVLPHLAAGKLTVVAVMAAAAIVVVTVRAVVRSRARRSPLRPATTAQRR